ncbi:hypothetical protein DPMN_071325 [Dreissena polymorpha]|uniref:Uncharacterized protein n=1 Tax=Dreissena polymorpha TaxID=45954 RepID=A0A9D3Z4C2_DREPO|nr:hypothetical protein DPMN_071325 [Dreissena polymorpha]
MIGLTEACTLLHSGHDRIDRGMNPVVKACTYTIASFVTAISRQNPVNNIINRIEDMVII